MLKILYTKNFLKQYKKLSPLVKDKTKKSIKKFSADPKSSSLGAHKLSGKLSDFYSFSVDQKVRIVFEMDKNSGAIIFLKVGGHDVYR